MLDEEDTDKDGMSLEVDTPVTNHRGDDDDDEEGGSSLLALVGEAPDPGFLLGKRVAPSSFPAIVMPKVYTPWTQVCPVDGALWQDRRPGKRGPHVSTCGVSVWFPRTSCLFPPQRDASASWRTKATPSAELLCVHAFSLDHRCSQVGSMSPLLRWRGGRARWPKPLTSYVEKPKGDPGRVPHGVALDP